MAAASPIAGPLWFVQVQSSWRRQSSWCGPVAGVLTAPCGAMDAAAPTDISKARKNPRQDKSPAPAGLFLFLCLNSLYRSLTSNDDDSSGGASDGGDASPNTCDANGGGANPSAGDASPSGGGPSRGGGRGP